MGVNNGVQQHINFIFLSLLSAFMATGNARECYILYCSLLTCLPCSKLIALYGYRTMLRSALLLTMSGCGLLSLALGCYSIIGALFAVFAIATGVAAMQVVANPYLTLLSQEHKRVGNLTLASAINSLGTTLAPLLIALALRASPIDYVNHNEPIKWIWFVLALFSVGLFAITFSIKLPDIIQDKKIKLTHRPYGVIPSLFIPQLPYLSMLAWRFH